jgi:hypothetical protein
MGTRFQHTSILLVLLQNTAWMTFAAYTYVLGPLVWRLLVFYAALLWKISTGASLGNVFFTDKYL